MNKAERIKENEFYIKDSKEKIAQAKKDIIEEQNYIISFTKKNQINRRLTDEEYDALSQSKWKKLMLEEIIK